jgi:hypothetical protein
MAASTPAKGTVRSNSLPREERELQTQRENGQNLNCQPSRRALAEKFQQQKLQERETGGGVSCQAGWKRAERIRELGSVQEIFYDPDWFGP